MSKEIKILGVIAIAIIVAGIVGMRLYKGSNTGVRIGDSESASVERITSEALVRPDSPTLGPADAKVTIVEFLDPECEACAAFHPVVKKTLKDYDGKLRLVVRYMPLHPNSLSAATFLEAAGEQGKFWEAQDKLFLMQPEWGTKHGSNAPQADINVLFRKYASELGLDAGKMNSAFAGNLFADKIERDRKDGESVGVRQTPTIFVNGRKLSQLTEAALKYLIDDELKR